MSRADVTRARSRCAIYTRKSSEEGLDQAFNSLHAQREACEAYILSQVGEGWAASPVLYDDGGFSGGNMDRPALARLLADVTSGRVDVVVVYKIDRLTRSLMDFSRIVEKFDAAGVSFVSVTQAFNTTTSMGRLTLNVLLSFAQFEREVTGERIRDKIAASKAKGMWMGGNLPLGYDTPTDLATRALRVNSDEAQTVNLIFRRYLELESVHMLERWLDEQQIRSKVQISAKGVARGGLRFGRGALFHLLKNRVYLGEILHKGETSASGHPPIVDLETFNAVQAKLSEGANERRVRPVKTAAVVLKGLIFDAAGRPMTPVFSYGHRGRAYRYYVSSPLQLGGRHGEDETLRRLPGDETDAFVIGRLTRLLPVAIADPIDRVLRRVDIHPDQVQLVLETKSVLGRVGAGANDGGLKRRLEPGETWIDDAADGLVRLAIPVRLKFRGGRTWLSRPNGQDATGRTNIDRSLVKALASAHGILAEHDLRRTGLAVSEDARSPTNPYHRKLALLAFMSPQMQSSIVEGRQPAGLKLEQLLRTEMPLAWADQKTRFGF